MPKYEGEAASHGDRFNIEIITKEGIGSPALASFKLPQSADFWVCGVGGNEREALRNLVSANSQYQIRVGRQTSEEPLIPGELLYIPT